MNTAAAAHNQLIQDRLDQLESWRFLAAHGRNDLDERIAKLELEVARMSNWYIPELKR